MSEKQDEKKDLNYYLEHPSEMPTEPAELERLVAEQAAADAAVEGVAAEKKTDKPAEEKKTEETVTATGAADKAATTKIDGVLTKDGKNVIPYAEMERRLEDERSRTGASEAAKAAVEQHAKELQAQLEAANARVAAAEKGVAAKADIKAATEIPEELKAKVKEEFPTFWALFEAQGALIAQQNEKFESLAKQVGAVNEDRRKTAEEEVQELIDQNPDLKAWQEKTPYLFERAQAVEDALLGGKLKLPEGVTLSLAQLAKDDAARHQLVVSIVKREVGLPAESPKKEEPKLLEKADEAVEAARKAGAVPRSLSDLNGGDPAKNETEALEGADAAVLGQRMLKLAAEGKLEGYLARL